MLTLTSPIETWAHRLPVGGKLAALAGATVILFALTSPIHLAGTALATAALIGSGGRAFARESVAMLRPLIPFIAIVALWHLWLRDPGGVSILLRMVTAVALANFVTMTSRLSDVIAVLQTALRPLSWLMPAKALALAMALVIRFVPTMLARHAQITEGWRARSHRRPSWRTLLPTTLATLDDADRVAEAIRARGGIG